MIHETITSSTEFWIRPRKAIQKHLGRILILIISQQIQLFHVGALIYNSIDPMHQHILETALDIV
eukprot:1566849-Ditylum_brightwellii.AAC.1